MSDLTAEQNARIFEAVRRAANELYGGKQAPLARAIGIAPPSLSPIFLGKGGASHATADAIAKIYRLTKEQLLDPSFPLPKPRKIEETDISLYSPDPDDPSPNRRAVIAILKSWGVSQTAINHIRSIDVSLSRPHWRWAKMALDRMAADIEAFGENDPQVQPKVLRSDIYLDEEFPDSSVNARLFGPEPEPPPKTPPPRVRRK